MLSYAPVAGPPQQHAASQLKLLCMLRELELRALSEVFGPAASMQESAGLSFTFGAWVSIHQHRPTGALPSHSPAEEPGRLPAEWADDLAELEGEMESSSPEGDLQVAVCWCLQHLQLLHATQ